MPTAQFEIECDYAEMVVKAATFEDRENVTYSVVDGNKIVLQFKAKTVKSLIKATYSVCNKIQLSMETVEKFKPKKSE
ncbi:hypothetical protein ECANGB1_242 [Enterospora canceri]|uniref:Uncharacterized protein n=1 Tax=Enterospora canceri TaxID=1081671 RepID=A0A1Y1S9D1_9MICR|nr:hypothetical protein ECANGB1_242 [Enterospora canceri]